MSIKQLTFPAILLACVGLLIGLFLLTNKPSDKNSPSNAFTPWAASNDPAALKARLQSINLPALAAEGTTLHIHQHLDVYVNGKQVEVPSHIGIPTDESYISPIHTHDTTGIMHVESPTVTDFFLGQFFTIWNVKLDAANLGDFKADDTNKLRVYVNGQLVDGNPAEIKLAAHQEIVITYGTDAQLPNPIPSTYSFPSGL